MRPARLAAAALAALALAAAVAACKPSSLSPFGLGHRGRDAGEGAYSGSWAGGNSSGGTVTFTVVSDTVKTLVLTHLTATCITTFTIDATATIEEEAFDFLVPLDPQGQFAIHGRFTSPEAASGRYNFEAMVTSAKCPSSGSGDFTAGKLPPAN